MLPQLRSVRPRPRLACYSCLPSHLASSPLLITHPEDARCCDRMKIYKYLRKEMLELTGGTTEGETHGAAMRMAVRPASSCGIAPRSFWERGRAGCASKNYPA